MFFFVTLLCVQLVLEGGEEELRPHALLVDVKWATQLKLIHCQQHQDRWQ